MSAIDSTSHSYVGNFVGLPVYHPIDRIDYSDIKATPNNLVIGGGSGEHPACVVESLDACVWQFINTMIIAQKKDPDNIKEIDQWEEDLSEEEQDWYHARSGYYNLTFYGWSMKNTEEFSKKINKKFNESIVYCSPLKDTESYSSETKIAIMLGEFLYFSASHLLSEKLQTYIKEEMKPMFEKEDLNIYPLYYALEVAPRGYPSYSGKYIAMDIESGQTKAIWGLRFEDEHIVDLNLNQYYTNEYNKQSIKLK